MPTLTLPYFDLVAIVVIAVLVSLLLRRQGEAPAKPTTTRGAFNLTIRHTHELTAETVTQLGVMFETTAAQVWADQVAPMLERIYPATQPATRYAAPPEPEERLAHDLPRAHAVVRGATELQAAARAAGKYLPTDEAMRQAMAMLDKTYNSQEPV